MKIYLIENNRFYKFYNLFFKVAADLKVDIDTVKSEHFASDLTLKEKIEFLIKDCDLIVVDLSNANQSVIFEFGFAQALKKPMIVFANSSRSLPYEIDLSKYFIQFYDENNEVDTINKLMASIVEFSENPKRYQYNNTENILKKKKVFISYSHNDNDYLHRVTIHLKPLENDGLIDLWDDRKIKTGDKWKQEIENALSQAQVAILLISADFLASDFIVNNELPTLLRKAEENGTRIIPLLLKPSRFSRDKNLSIFQAINDPQKTLSGLSEHEREYYYDKVSEEIEKSFG